MQWITLHGGLVGKMSWLIKLNGKHNRGYQILRIRKTLESNGQHTETRIFSDINLLFVPNSSRVKYDQNGNIIVGPANAIISDKIDVETNDFIVKGDISWRIRGMDSYPNDKIHYLSLLREEHDI